MREKVHKYIYLFGLCLFVLSVAVSEYITSISIWILVTNWFFHFNFREKAIIFIRKKGIAVFLLLFFAHVFWLINTSNFDFAFNDLRIKLPLLVFPVIIGTTKEISQKELVLVIKFFILGLLISTLSGLLAYFNVINVPDTDNMRNLSIYISHIRLALMLCLAIFILVYFIDKKIFKSKTEIILSSIILIWLAAFMFKVQVATGIIIFFLIGFYLLYQKLKKEKKLVRKVFYLSTIIIVPLFILVYLIVFIHDFYTPTQKNQGTEIYTAQNNIYYNDFENMFIENGNYIYRDICEKELYETWEKRSNVSLDSITRSNQKLLHTLLRYMTSRGLKKDAEGVTQLSDGDIRAIEAGKTNYRFKNKSFINERLYSIIWQLDIYAKGGNPSGHSVTQRLEYIKAAFTILYQNFWTGTGTGDLDDAYRKYYSETNHVLKPEFQHRAHNQYLTFFVTFGVFGAFLCFFAIFYPVIINKAHNNYYFMIFFAIALISMINEDTLETMIGVVFFSFFYSLFMWGIDTN